jgi:hypothetical protein
MRVAIAAAAVLFLAVALQPAEAACGSIGILGTRAATGPSFIWTEGQFTPGYYPGYPPFDPAVTAPVTPAFDGIFWALGTGDPVSGPGDDSDTWTASAAGWFYFNPSYFGGAYAGEVFTGWGASAEIDGCILLNPTGCTCMLLTDEDGVNGYMALLAAERDAGGSTFFDQPGLDGAGNASPIVLQAIPAPTITNTIRRPSLDLDITVTVPPVVAGLYQKAPCDCTEGLAYKVLAVQQTRGLAPPSTRDAAAWVELDLPGTLPQGATPVGTAVTVESLCGATNTDVYVATQLVFDTVSGGGFPATVVSANSTRIECGPQIAEPEPLRPKVRPDAPRNIRNPRSERSR